MVKVRKVGGRGTMSYEKDEGISCTACQAKNKERRSWQNMIIQRVETNSQSWES